MIRPGNHEQQEILAKRERQLQVHRSFKFSKAHFLYEVDKQNHHPYRLWSMGFQWLFLLARQRLANTPTIDC